ncbi:MAG: NADH-quinone oxidoreductase subunit J [Chloroflexota bacterium]|jgi:NADH-quinone oxidoreductase subunit J
MSGLQIAFLITAAVTLFAAGMMIGARRMMHSALWLVLALMGVAVIFATLQASFFVVVQILIYIGAIAILIIFSIMLTRRTMEDEGRMVLPGWRVSALVVVLLFSILVGFLATWQGFNAVLVELPDDAENLLALGRALVDPQGYVLPFELASVLLLAALVGAIYIAIDRKEDNSS